MARKTKLTPEVQETIVGALRKGNWLIAACAQAGVDEKTVYEWISRGEGRDRGRRRTPLYAAFADACREAMSRAETEAVEKWQRKFEDDWRAAAEFLARRYPERWSPTMRAEVKHAGEVAVTQKPDIASMSTRELIERAQKLEEMARNLMGDERYNKIAGENSIDCDSSQE